MTKEEITNGSKKIAEYMGFVYIPFSADLKDKGFKVAGWYKVEENKPNIQEVTQTSYKHGEEDKAIVQKVKVDLTKFRYTIKNGWTLIGDKYYKHVCRSHGELRYWNSLDALVPVIQKIKNKLNVEIWINPDGAEHTDFADKNWKTKICQSYDNNLQLSNNVFIVVIETLTHLEKYWKDESN